jgi:mRNA interferase RelE/StbE
MSYDLVFLPSALKEWKKLDSRTREMLKKKLAERLDYPRVPSAVLHGLKDCFKIKLRDVGFRLVYRVEDKIITVAVISVGRRDGDVYTIALERLRALGFRA